MSRAGFTPIRWGYTVNRLKALGVSCIQGKSKRDPRDSIIPGHSKKLMFAPTWAVLIAEAEPVQDAVIAWALSRALTDETFRRAIETIIMLNTTSARPRATVASYILEMWKP